MDKLKAKISGLTIKMLQDVVTEIYKTNQTNKEADMILDLSMTELEKKMNEKDFIHFCEKLEKL